MDNEHSNEEPTHIPHGDEPISDNWFDYDDDETEIIVHQVVWNCDDCGEQNTTNRRDALPVCEECGRVYDWISIAGDGTYEQTMTSDGDVDFDAYVPDYPDDFVEPEPPDEPMEGEP